MRKCKAVKLAVCVGSAVHVTPYVWREGQLRNYLGPISGQTHRRSDKGHSEELLERGTSLLQACIATTTVRCADLVRMFGVVTLLD